MSHGLLGRDSCCIRPLIRVLHSEDSTRRDRAGRWLWRLVSLNLRHPETLEFDTTMNRMLYLSEQKAMLLEERAAYPTCFGANFWNPTGERVCLKRPINLRTEPLARGVPATVE